MDSQIAVEKNEFKPQHCHTFKQALCYKSNHSNNQKRTIYYLQIPKDGNMEAYIYCISQIKSILLFIWIYF